MAYYLKEHCASNIGGGSEPGVERASLTCRLNYLSQQLTKILEMGRALAGPLGDGKCAEEDPAIYPIAGELHHLMDSISCKAEAIEGQLKVLTNEL